MRPPAFHDLAGLRFGLAADDVDVDVPAHADQVVHHRAAQELDPAGTDRFPGDDLGDVVAVGILQHGFRHGLPGTADGAGAQFLGQAQGTGHLVALFLGKPGLVGCLHVDGEPFGIQFVRQAPGGADQAFAQRARADADQQALAGRPGTGDGARAHVGAHLVIHPFGGAPHGQLAQGGQVAFAEEFLDGALGLVGDVYLAILSGV